MRVLVTGATGFVGRSLVPFLAAKGYRIRAALRDAVELPAGIEGAVIGDLTRPVHLADALRAVSAVIHCAGLAHSTGTVPEADYRRVNTQATLELAQAAARSGVKRFLFLSSVRAQTGPVCEERLTEEMPARPVDAYGRSKLAAEEGLAKLDCDWAALRPVLVYGPGVKGNMGALLALARSPWPLPLGASTARRSLLAAENLNGAIDHLLQEKSALRRPFLVSDSESLTIPEIVTALRQGLNRKPGLIPVPPVLLKTAAALAKKSEAFERLSGVLTVDPSALKALGWIPAVSTPRGLAALARDAARGG